MRFERIEVTESREGGSDDDSNGDDRAKVGESDDGLDEDGGG